MFSFRVTRVLATACLGLAMILFTTSAGAESVQDSQQAGSQVTIPITELQNASGAKLMQYYPGQPYAKCLVPGELFAAGGLLDLARIESGETYTVNFPNATLSYEVSGMRHQVNGDGTLKISGLVLEGTELLATCRISYRGVPTENNDYTISLSAEGAGRASELVTRRTAQLAPIREEPKYEMATNVSVPYNPAPLRPEDDSGGPADGGGDSGTGVPPAGEGSLGEPPSPVGEGGLGTPPRATGDYEPVGDREIDRGGVEPGDTSTTSTGDQPGDKIFVANGGDTGAGVEGNNQETAGSPDFTSQNLVAMSGSGCSLTASEGPSDLLWPVLLVLVAGLLPIRRIRRHIPI